MLTAALVAPALLLPRSSPCAETPQAQAAPPAALNHADEESRPLRLMSGGQPVHSIAVNATDAVGVVALAAEADVRTPTVVQIIETVGGGTPPRTRHLAIRSGNASTAFAVGAQCERLQAQSYPLRPTLAGDPPLPITVGTPVTATKLEAGARSLPRTPPPTGNSPTKAVASAAIDDSWRLHVALADRPGDPQLVEITVLDGTAKHVFYEPCTEKDFTTSIPTSFRGGAGSVVTVQAVTATLGGAIGNSLEWSAAPPT
ncbi:MAG TPA: hypothetical protein PKC43_10100 [Phycisphaerales bacterium]|nr:hypothetical protein [Phycisphaerales bacterium]HMP37787.1 hypothetical protein [Phycisphaerales bacterium]